MVYQNKKGQPRERCMIAAQVLSDEFGAKQAAIAEALNCSQSTVAAWIKEVRYKKDIDYLESELESAREYAKDLVDVIDIDNPREITHDKKDI